jgi:hypothetical protein
MPHPRRVQSATTKPRAYRLTDAEDALVGRLAARWGLRTKSEAVRRALAEAAEREGVS